MCNLIHIYIYTYLSNLVSPYGALRQDIFSSIETRPMVTVQDTLVEAFDQLPTSLQQKWHFSHEKNDSW